MTCARLHHRARGSVCDRHGAGRRAADVSGRALRSARRRRALAHAGATTAPGNGILPAAEDLAKQGVDAIMVIGTSLTFYRGSDFHERAAGEAARGDRPAGEHHEPGGGRRAAQLRRPADRGRDRLRRRREQPAESDFSRRKASRCWRSRASACSASASPAARARRTSSRSARKVCRRAPAAEGLLISCGGLRTLGRGEAARGAPRHSGGVEHAGGVLGGAAARRRERPGRRPRAGCWSNRQRLPVH